MEFLTQDGAEFFEFKNLKNIIMKYRANIEVVSVVCTQVCPGIRRVYEYQV
jgi:hypothetical protein